MSPEKLSKFILDRIYNKNILNIYYKNIKIPVMPNQWNHTENSILDSNDIQFFRSSVHAIGEDFLYFSNEIKKNLVKEIFFKEREELKICFYASYKSVYENDEYIEEISSVETINCYVYDFVEGPMLREIGIFIPVKNKKIVKKYNRFEIMDI